MENDEGLRRTSHVVDMGNLRDSGGMTTKSQNEIVQKARDAFKKGMTRSYEFRRKQLQQLIKMCEENRDLVQEALYKDLRKCKFEANMCEIDLVISEAQNTINNLKSWMKPKYPAKNLMTAMNELKIYHDPWGVALVIGSWNYPFCLILMPLIGAISGGNCVIIKPSECAPACASLFAKIMPKYLDRDCFHVVCGGPEETKLLLKEKFDYVFYTGSAKVGKLVRQAANEHLTPVTLEMGGKSPVYLDDTVNMDVAAKRILWGKFLNAGQTCIAPDYMMCTKKVQDKFLTAADKVIKAFYGSEASKSKDFCRIINETHFKRLEGLLQTGKIAIGGTCDMNDTYVSPTVVTDVKLTDPIMNDEVFGPILPIYTVESPQEAVKFINEKDPPLTCYVFSTSKSVHNLFINGTTSGSILFNETLMHFGVNTLPFGGVGPSGIGAYLGKFSFNTFTHKKSCLVKTYNPLEEKCSSIRYPPYTDTHMKMMEMIIKSPYKIDYSLLYSVFLFLFGFILGAVGMFFLK